MPKTRLPCRDVLTDMLCVLLARKYMLLEVIYFSISVQYGF